LHPSDRQAVHPLQGKGTMTAWHVGTTTKGTVLAQLLASGSKGRSRNCTKMSHALGNRR
jgi:hypothetical protein